MRYSGMILRHKYGGKEYKLKQVSRQIARKTYNNGGIVFLQSCNMRWGNMWQTPCPISLHIHADRTFDYEVADYVYYNCDRERGRYPHYFIET